MTDLSLYAERFNNQTVRIVARVSIGGMGVRVRLSNTFGSEPLVIGAGCIAIAETGAAVMPGSNRSLTFGGQKGVTIPAGESALSDLSDMTVPPAAYLAVSLYFPRPVTAATGNFGSGKRYVSRRGDYTAAEKLPLSRARRGGDPAQVPVLSRIDVATRESAGAIVAFGDSITVAGWPDYLVERLRAAGIDHLSVLRQGISGNRILHDSSPAAGGLFGPSGLSRFAEDALAQPGVRYVAVLEGVNDLLHPGSVAPISETVSPEELIAGLREYADSAHRKGIKILGGTILPFEGYEGATAQAEMEARRQVVNRWIRTGGAFDAVFDTDQATRDPTHPARLLPIYDSGDHLHPSEEGSKAIAEAIDLSLFKNGG